MADDVEKQLDQNLRSHAFDGYDDMGGGGGDAEQDLAVKHTLMYVVHAGRCARPWCLRSGGTRL